jgi:hypothetical protein
MLLFTLSCRYSDQWETKNINNEFSAEIPSWMEKTDKLKEGAPLQYRNRFRNVYFIVIKERQDTLPPFEKYVERNTEVLKRALSRPLITDSTEVELSGLKGVKTEIVGNMGEEKIFYTHYSLQGNSGYYYQLCVWTRGEERKLRYGSEMNRMIESFRLL